MTLPEIIKLLKDGPRMGAEADKPEGTRYIRISDTLAAQIAERLQDYHHELIAYDLAFDNLTRGLHDEQRI